MNALRYEIRSQPLPQPTVQFNANREVINWLQSAWASQDVHGYPCLDVEGTLQPIATMYNVIFSDTEAYASCKVCFCLSHGDGEPYLLGAIWDPTRLIVLWLCSEPSAFTLIRCLLWSLHWLGMSSKNPMSRGNYYKVHNRRVQPRNQCLYVHSLCHVMYRIHGLLRKGIHFLLYNFVRTVLCCQFDSRVNFRDSVSSI